MAKISIIVPVYKVENYIGRCIESIQNQSFSDWELILIDDCSPDNSNSIIQQYADRDERLIVKRLASNHGPLIARRLGDSIASGDYITYCDGDDVLPSDALKIMYSEALKTNADIVSGNIMYMTTDGNSIIWESTLKYGNDRISAYKSLLRLELRQNLCGKLFKSSLLKEYSYKTYEHFTNGEDGYIFYLVVDHIDKIIQIQTPIYYYMQNTESSSQKRLNERAIEGVCILNKTKHDLLKGYSGLKKDLETRITTIMCSLYARGYDKDANLNYYIKEYGLENYITPRSIIKRCEPRTMIRLLISRIRHLF